MRFIFPAHSLLPRGLRRRADTKATHKSQAQICARRSEDLQRRFIKLLLLRGHHSLLIFGLLHLLAAVATLPGSGTRNNSQIGILPATPCACSLQTITMPSLEKIPEEPSPLRPNSPRNSGSLEARRNVNFSRPRPFSPPSSNPPSSLASPTFERPRPFEASSESDRTPTSETPPTLENSLASEKPQTSERPSTSGRQSAPESQPSFQKSPTFESSPVIDQAFRPRFQSHQPYAQNQHDSRHQPESRNQAPDHSLRSQRQEYVHRDQSAHQQPREEQRLPARYDDDNQSYDDDDAAPFPVIRTFSEKHDQPYHSKSQNPQTWIYKPYADSVVSSQDSDASSIASEETMTTADTDSIADSTTTGYSEETDFAFDGQMGWAPTQRPSQAERERQRWAAPVVRQPHEDRSRQFNSSAGYQDHDDYAYNDQQNGNMPTSSSNRESWLSDTSDGTVTTQDSFGPPSAAPPPLFGGQTNGRVNGSGSGSGYMNGQSSGQSSRPPLAGTNGQKTGSSNGYGSRPSLAQTSGQTSRSTNTQSSGRRNHRDIFEAAGERKGSLYAPPSRSSTQLARSGSNSTDRSNDSDQRRPGNLTTNNVSRLNNTVGSGPIRPRNPTSTTSTSSLTSEDWRGSEVDISSLSPEKIKKLEKKGINPSLYLEMKQARNKGGKKKSGFVGVLTGNSFLS